MITVYGATQTRTFRVLWMLEELGVEFEHVPTPPGEARSRAFLKINPNGHVPALVDDGFTIVESMAINLFLAARYGGGLWPGTVNEQGAAFQWSFWALQELEADLLLALRHRLLLPEDERDPAEAGAAAERLAAPLAVLDGVLGGREYLLGTDFSVADLNVASVLSWARGGGVSLAPTPGVERWFGACFGRPARRAAGKR